MLANKKRLLAQADRKKPSQDNVYLTRLFYGLNFVLKCKNKRLK
jgi:hypothetical protein